MDTVAQMLDFVRRCAQGSASLARDEVKTLHRLVEASKAFLKAKKILLLQEYPACPVLYQYSGDCTPVHVRQYGTVGAGEKRRKVSGKEAQEFYVHQLFVTLMAPDGHKHHTI